MDRHVDASPLLPGSQDLIRFPDQDCWFVTGDRQRAALYRGAALQLKAGLVASSGGLAICSTSRRCDDGTVIDIRKAGSIFQLRIHCPVGSAVSGQEAPARVPALSPGQFFWVPGCFARYGFREGRELQNEILRKSGSVSGDTKNEGFGVVFEDLADVGLPAPGTSPDGSISRRYRTCWLEGVGPDSGEYSSQFKMASAHLPAKGSFSISCVVRLREPIQMDYSFQYRTAELGNDYTVWNPIKARLLTSTDGVTWSAACPGSLAPLVGYKIPSRFSNHWANFTYPWPSYNDDFVAGVRKQIGCREIENICPNEPLMASDYDAASPYWDKVTTGELKTYEGEYIEFIEKNSEINNSSPYESFCKWKTPFKRDYDIKTRVVSERDGIKLYGTIHESEYITEEVILAGVVNYEVGDEVTIGNLKGTVEEIVHVENIKTIVTLVTFTVFTIKDYL